MSQRPRLVINADDFGCSPRIDEGILACHAAGTVNATSLLVTFPERLPESVLLLKNQPSLSPGLHLDLTWGPEAWPRKLGLTTHSGCTVRTAGRLLRHLLGGRISRTALREAVRQQFVRYAETGLPLTHVDTHQHVLCLPGVFQVVNDCCREYGVNYLRIPREAAHGAHGGGWKRLVMAMFAWGKRYGRAFHVAGTVNSGRWREAELLAVLDRLPQGAMTEIVTHPGSCGQHSELPDKLAACREAELQALTSPGLKDRLNSITFENFSHA